MNVKRKLTLVNPRKLTSNTQKAAYRLLSANGKWLSKPDLDRTIGSAPSRVRDLRKSKFGSFRVECKQATELNKRGNAFFYRINPNTVTHKQVDIVFRIG